MAQHIYLETNPNSGMFHYHGEADGPNDDPQSFKRQMESAGHRVFIRSEKFGIEVAGIPGGNREPSEEQLAGRNIPLATFEGA